MLGLVEMDEQAARRRSAQEELQAQQPGRAVMSPSGRCNTPTRFCVEGRMHPHTLHRSGLGLGQSVGPVRTNLRVRPGSPVCTCFLRFKFQSWPLDSFVPWSIIIFFSTFRESNTHISKFKLGASSFLGFQERE